MSKSKRSYEERIEELRLKEQAALETAKSMRNERNNWNAGKRMRRQG